MVGVMSPEVSMVTPRSSASGRSVSVASSATRDRSTCSRVKDRRSARLSRSNASVRSIARVLTAWRRSTSSPVSRLGSLRATSSSVCVIASGVRSSWEALAANRCCSATCASSRASMASKASASSRNSSCGPAAGCGGRAIRSRPACGVRDASQRGEHPAGEKPSSQRDRTPAGTPTPRLPLGAKTRRRLERPGKDDRERGWEMSASAGRNRSRNSHTAASSKAPASMRNPA